MSTLSKLKEWMAAHQHSNDTMDHNPGDSQSRSLVLDHRTVGVREQLASSMLAASWADATIIPAQAAATKGKRKLLLRTMTTR